MCGILGLVARKGEPLSVLPERFAQMRDLMYQRGPDGAGLVVQNHVIFAHRMLEVMDPGNGTQPMWSPCGRYLLVYNGELYNDAELRSLLTLRGYKFTTHCDTETLLHAFTEWGTDCLPRLRGMFAFGVYDFVEDVLTLVRDPLGIKPLYFAQLNDEIIFSSHIPSILAHPQAVARPNMSVVSAYLSTIRVTLGNATMFDGISTLRPGQMVQIQCAGNHREFTGSDYWKDVCPPNDPASYSFEDAATQVRSAIEDSVRRHLVSDVPRCLLLSGGIDSTIITQLAKDQGARDALRTWCASDPTDEGGDQEHAMLVADNIGAVHEKVIVDYNVFSDHWSELIAETGFPLSTPNETAIYAVAKALKPYATVTLSGEGADELFAGYALPMLSGIDVLRASLSDDQWPGGDAGKSRYRQELIEQYGDASLGTPVDQYLRCNTWIHPDLKENVLTPDAIQIAGRCDDALITELGYQYSLSGGSLHPAEELLRVHRRMNLTGLLRRFDTSMMAAGVEGRTPFADSKVAELAMRIPFDYKMQVENATDGGWSSAATTVATNRVMTKRVLRSAFAREVPPVILNRPKASFPLPFQDWLGSGLQSLRNNEMLSHMVQQSVLDVVEADPKGQWQLAWPIVNLAMWCQRWWG